MLLMWNRGAGPGDSLQPYLPYFFEPSCEITLIKNCSELPTRRRHRMSRSEAIVSRVAALSLDTSCEKQEYTMFIDVIIVWFTVSRLEGSRRECFHGTANQPDIR